MIATIQLTIQKHPKRVGWVERSETHPHSSNAQPGRRHDPSINVLTLSRNRHKSSMRRDRTESGSAACASRIMRSVVGQSTQASVTEQP